MERAFLLIEVTGVHTHTHQKANRTPGEHELVDEAHVIKRIPRRVCFLGNVSAWHFLLKQSSQKTSLFNFLKDYSILPRSTREYNIYIHLYIVYSCSDPSWKSRSQPTSTTAGNIHLHQQFFVWSRKRPSRKLLNGPKLYSCTIPCKEGNLVCKVMAGQPTPPY